MKQDTFTAIVFGFVIAVVIFMVASASNYKLESDSDKDLTYESLQSQKDTNLESNIINDKTNELDNDSAIKNTVNNKVENNKTSNVKLSNETDNDKESNTDTSLNKNQTINEDSDNEKSKNSNNNSVFVENNNEILDEVQMEEIDEKDMEKIPDIDEKLNNKESLKEKIAKKYYLRVGLNNDEGKSVVLVDKSKGEYCLQVIDVFYSDANYEYYFTCLKSPSMYVIKNGKEYKLVDALKSGIVTISELEVNGYTFPKKSRNLAVR